MYNWRQMSTEQRAEALRIRKQLGQPWHGPPHGLENAWFHVSAACYEHHPILGASPERLASFERDLLCTVAPVCEGVSAWCVMPNHYHFLVQCINLKAVRTALGRLHGRTSHDWNIEDGAPGRRCWHRCLPKPVKSESHRWATLNYIHHNPVHHGYATIWQCWPFSSAEQYLAAVGRGFAEKIWSEHPLFDFGKGWDDPDM